MIVAEISANHKQDKERAKEIIKAASESGADAVKLQTYTADTLTIDSDKEYFKIDCGTPWDGMTLHQLYREASTPWEWHAELKEYAESLGLSLFSAPFDYTAVDFLQNLGIDTFKIASFEALDLPLVEYAAARCKTIMISTGIASREQLAEVVGVCRKAGNNDIILLKCTSAYPAKIDDANIATIEDMKSLGVNVGLSDHTLELEVPLAAVALGACVVEKHFTLDRGDGGHDAEFSLTPEVFGQMTLSIRKLEKALGRVKYSQADQKNLVFARSIFVVKDIAKGEALTAENIRSIRPGFGLEPKLMPEVLGKKAKKELKRGTPLRMEDLE